MRLTVWVLGTEVLTVSTDPPPAAEPASEADGVEITRHAGSFDLGFAQRTPRWSAVEGEGP